jgi:adenosylmethionine-8-amino-7-oxononanoate aminotransferase
MKTRMISVRGGYHGDTFGAMSVCDPINGMHAAFGNKVLAQQLFVTRPPCDPNYTIRPSNETQSNFTFVMTTVNSKLQDFSVAFADC